MVTKIETVKIEKKRGQLAVAEGTFQYVANKTLPLKALYQKGKEGDWKVKAVDYGDSGLIKGFKISGWSNEINIGIIPESYSVHIISFRHCFDGEIQVWFLRDCWFCE